MKLTEAINVMSKGKKVKFEEWGGAYAYLKDGTVWLYDKVERRHRIMSCLTKYITGEWKLYEEETEAKKKITEALLKKIDEATPEEIEKAMKFFDDLEKKEDDWCLAEQVRKTYPVNTDLTHYRDGVFVEDIKTFIQKTKEDDNEAKKTVEKSVKSSASVSGYIDGINDADYHRQKRAGNL